MVAVSVVCLAAQRVGWGELMQSVLDRVRAAGPLVFFAAMAILPVVGFPLSPFALVAGPAFAPTLGTGTVVACAILAVMVNVALSYGVAARGLAPVAARRGWKIPRPPARLTFLLILLLRVAPGLPFWVQSYLLGLIRAPFLPYMAVSTLVPAVYLSVTILASTAVLQGRKATAGFALATILVVGIALHFFRRRHEAEITAMRSTEGPGVCRK